MPLSDSQIDALIAEGATDDEILEISKARFSASKPTPMSTGRALAENTPFGPTMLRKQDTGSFYGKGVEGAAQGLGDVGTAAGLGAAGMALGAAPVALGVGAGALVGAGLEKTGVSPWLREKGQQIREGGEVPQDPSVLKNFLKMLPREAAATGVEMVPAVTSGLLSGLGMKGLVKGASKIKPSTMPQAITDIEGYGGKAMPSATGSGVAKIFEGSARTNPLLKGRYAKIDTQNLEAARKFAQERFGEDITTPVNVGIGKKMGETLGSMAERRSADYKPALEALKSAKGFPGFKKMLVSSVDQIADEANVTGSASKAFKTSLQEALNESGPSPVKLDKALTDVRIKFANKFSTADQAVLGQVERDFDVLMGGLKDRYYQGLDNISSNLDASGKIQKGSLGSMLREAKADYRDASQAINPLNKIISSRHAKPEAVMGDVLKSGSEGVKTLVESMSPAEKTAFRKEAARYILEKSKNKNGDISAASIETALGKDFKDILPILFGEGEELGNITRLKDMMKASRIAELSAQNPPSSGTFLVEQAQGPIGGMAAAGFGQLPTYLKAMAAKTLLADVPYTFAGRTAQTGANKAQSALAALAKKYPNVNLKALAAGGSLGTLPATQSAQ